MIISASRRTDLPAFFSEWLMDRLRKGFCLVQNPFNRKTVSRISLLSNDVDVIVFWSKNPLPLIKHFKEIDSLGHRYYFQYTLNAYPLFLEPKVPPLQERINTFIEISKRLGANRIIWRYDPIIISNITSFDFHMREFGHLAKQLSGSTKRVVISLVDYYRKTNRRLSELSKHGVILNKNPESTEQLQYLLKDMASVANAYDLEIVSCAEECDYSNLGICPGRCIDGDLINSLWPMGGKWKKDPGQRDACGCVVSRDIGMPDTCQHNCVYCYATVSENAAQNNWKKHDPKSAMLVGSAMADDNLVAPAQRSLF